MQVQNLPKLYQTVFKDKKYAWEVLAAQVELQLSNIAQGQQITKLLSLYMHGVQIMNSIMDPRQAYFRSKLITLMGRQNVIKGLNTPKKNVPDKNNQQKIISEAQYSIQQKQTHPNVTPFSFLQEKKKQIEMRLAYGVEANSPEALNKMIRQVEDKSINISKTVQNIIESHQRNLQDRIRKRKLRTTTARSNADVNQFDNQNQDDQNKNKNLSNKNIVDIDSKIPANTDNNNDANLKFVFSKKKVCHEFASSSQKQIQVKKQQKVSCRRQIRSVERQRFDQIDRVNFSIRRNSIDLLIK